MKYIIFAAILLMVCGATEKDIYVIRGTTDATYPDDSVYLMDERNELLAEAPVVNGKFEIRGRVEAPILACLGPTTGIATPLILENGAEYTAHLTGARATVKGGGELHRLVGYYDNTDEFFTLVTAYMKVEEEVMSKPGVDPDNLDPEDYSRMVEASDAAYAAEDRAMFKVIDDPKAPPLARAFAIARSQNWERLPMERRLALLDRLNEELGGNAYVTALRKDYEEDMVTEAAMKEAKGWLVEGVPLKDFEVKDAAGNTVKLSEVVARNKYTILEFWASWCKPCRAEIPNLKKAYEKYKSRGLEILAVSLDERIKDWLGALEKENTPWLNYHDPNHFDGEAARLYAVEAIPSSFLISRDGKLVVVDEKALRGPNLEETLEEFLK